MTLNENSLRTLGRYRLIEEIGRGGMAVVYRAMDTNLNREVAVKLLHPHLASHGESRTRFYREAQAVARLKHESVLEIYDYSGDDGEEVFIVMELVEGTTLRRLLDERNQEPLFAEGAALLIRPVLTALAHAHAHGLIHRDVKPENILIGPKAAVKLSDFGIAHIAGMTEMTITGQILGSPSYMSPEHVELVELDARADIFSVGIVLYEMAVGHQPFAGKSAHAVLKRIIDGNYEDPLHALPSVGLPITKIIRKCLKPNPDDRYATVDLLIQDLDAMLSAMQIELSKPSLTAFLADTAAWTADHLPSVMAHTIGFGVQAKKKKQHQDAAAHFNRVLALDPGNEKALLQINGMNRNRTLRRVLERTAIVLTALTAMTAVAWAVLRPKPLPPVPPQVEEPETSIDRADTPTSPPPEAGAEEDEQSGKAETVHTAPTGEPEPAVKKPKPRTVPQKVMEPQFREVVFTPHPLSVKIIVDDEKPFPFGPANRSRILTTGKHKITFAPNDTKRFLEQSWTVNIPAGNTPFPFRGRLMWRPAKLLVKSDIDASVTVPGRVTDLTNHVFTVEVKKGPTEQLSVLISQEGYVPQTKQVTITAGELSTLNVKLAKSKVDP